MLEWLKKRSGRTAIALIVMLIAMGLALSFPPDIAFLFAIDMGTWFEAAIAVYVVAQVTRIRPLVAFLKARLAIRHRRAARRPRTAAVERKEASNDDKPRSPFALAA